MTDSLRFFLFLLAMLAIFCIPTYFFGPGWTLWSMIWLIGGWALASLVLRPSSSASDRG